MHDLAGQPITQQAVQLVGVPLSQHWPNRVRLGEVNGLVRPRWYGLVLARHLLEGGTPREPNTSTRRLLCAECMPKFGD